MPLERTTFFHSESQKSQQQILPRVVSGSADLDHMWLTSARATSLPSFILAR